VTDYSPRPAGFSRRAGFQKHNNCARRRAKPPAKGRASAFKFGRRSDDAKRRQASKLRDVVYPQAPVFREPRATIGRITRVKHLIQTREEVLCATPT